MKKTDWTIWLAFAGLFLSIIGSTTFLAFRMGVMNEKIMSMEQDLPQIKIDITDIKKDVTEMKVKLDVLWRMHLPPSKCSIQLNGDDPKAIKTTYSDMDSLQTNGCISYLPDCN